MRRHEIDVVSLIMGLLLVGSALLWGFAEDRDDVLDGWPVPTLLIVVGVAGLAASVRRRRRD